MRVVLLGALVVIGLAGLVRADDATPSPKERPRWSDLHEEYRRAHEAHGDTLTEISAVDRLLTDAEAKLAPLRAIAAQIASTCPKGDPRIAEAELAVMRRVYELKMGENRVRRSQLAQKELVTRESAIQTGSVALQAMLEYLERMGRAKASGREEQVAFVRSKSLVLMQQLELLENQGTPLLAPFTPLAVPDTPRQIAALIKIYEEDAKKSADLGASLTERLAVKKAQREPLLKLQERGVIVDEQRIRLLDARIEEIDTARLAALKRADDLRLEIGRLQQRKSDKEPGFSDKNDRKDGEKK